MGLLMSFMGKGLPTTRMLSLVMGTLYRKFMEKEIKSFDDFHVAILDMLNTIPKSFSYNILLSIPHILHNLTMGSFMSFMGKGKSLPTTQMLSQVIDTLCSKFMEKEITCFDYFHVAFLDMFNTINAAFPGKHCDVPPPNKVQEIFVKWEEVKDSEKKKLFIDFMKASVSTSKFNDSALMKGLVTPTVAMAVKRASETLPQLKMIKVIPDIIFVPAATVMALISAKLSKKMLLGNVAS